MGERQKHSGNRPSNSGADQGEGADQAAIAGPEDGAGQGDGADRANAGTPAVPSDNAANDPPTAPANQANAPATSPELMSRAELLRLMTERDIGRAIANGWITRVRRGAYRLNVPIVKLRMHLIVARAPEAVFSLLIAAYAWGLRKNLPRHLDVYVSRSRRGVRGARAHRRKATSFVRRGGFRFTTLAETLADLVDAWGPGIVANVIDRRYPTLAARAELIAEASALPAAKRAKILPILEWAPERAYSQVEAKIARALQMRGFDVELNVRIGAHTWDIVHRGARLVIEYDSLKYHLDKWAFREDRARQNALTRMNHAILRYSDADVDLRFDEMIGEICDTIAWRLGGEKHETDWDRFPCSEVYGWREIWAEESSPW